jgi:hypothetical protein
LFGLIIALLSLRFNKDDKNITQNQKIGRVFAEYEDNLVMTGGENMKEHGYLVPKTKIDRLGDNEIYFNISKISLKEFEIWLYLTRIIHLS